MIAIRACLFGLLLWPAVSGQTKTPAPDVWAPVRSLVGRWEGDASGQPGTGTTVREYRFLLGGRYLE